MAQAGLSLIQRSGAALLLICAMACLFLGYKFVMLCCLVAAFVLSKRFQSAASRRRRVVQHGYLDNQELLRDPTNISSPYRDFDPWRR